MPASSCSEVEAAAGRGLARPNREAERTGVCQRSSRGKAAIQAGVDV
jgi:hypothetical protein